MKIDDTHITNDKRYRVSSGMVKTNEISRVVSTKDYQEFMIETWIDTRCCEKSAFKSFESAYLD